MKADGQLSAMSLTGGGARQKRWRRPHERGLSVPKEPALFRDLEANQTAVHGSRRDRLDRLLLPWSGGRRTEGRAPRHVSARDQQEGGREGAPPPLGPSSTIARNVSARKSNEGAARQTPRKSLKLSMLGPAKWNPRRRSCPEPRNRGHADVVRSGEVFQRHRRRPGDLSLAKEKMH